MKWLRGIVGIFICTVGLGASQQTYAAETRWGSNTKPGFQIGDEIDESDPGLSKITKTFSVNALDKVILDNQYGTLNVKTWNKNEVRLDVIVYGNPELDARQLAGMVTVNALKKDGEVLLETRLKGGKRANGKKIRVEFLVYMPETNSLRLSHQYGNVNIGDFTGSVVASVQYGNFVAGDLKSSSNRLSISYGSTIIRNIKNAKISQEYGNGLTIGTVGTLSLDAAYAAVKINTITEKANISQQYGAGLTIGMVGQLDLDAAYARVQIGTIKAAAKISNQYSDLSIGVANGLSVSAQYSNVKIARLNGDSKLSIQYNSLNIDDVSVNCQSLVVDCGYVKTFIKFNNSYNGNLEATASNSSFKYGPGISMKVEGDKQTRRYLGRIGAGGSAKVNLVASYGSTIVN